MKTLENQRFWLIVLLSALGVVLVCYTTCLCCLWQSIKVAVNVIDASADFLRDTKRIILTPIIHFFMGVVIFLIWLGCFCCVISMNKIKASKKIPQMKDLTWTDRNFWLAVLMVFAIFWLLTVVEQLSNMVVMITASTYYFNNDQQTYQSG